MIIILSSSEIDRILIALLEIAQVGATHNVRAVQQSRGTEESQGKRADGINMKDQLWRSGILDIRLENGQEGEEYTVEKRKCKDSEDLSRMCFLIM